MRSNPPLPVTATLVVSIVPSMKEISLEPVILMSFAVLAKVESLIVIPPEPAVSIPTLLPETVIPSIVTSFVVREPYWYAAPALFAMVPESSPPKSFT